jgi:multicomponent Na+:H+ antiporter subunit G
MTDTLIVGLLAMGTLFTLLAAAGILKMPDVFTRMQAATKAATLGVACVVSGAAVHFGDLATVATALLIVVFLFITVPVAAHTIGRAAYVAGAPLWEGTIVDELRGQYAKGGRLAAGADEHALPPPPPPQPRTDGHRPGNP